MIQQALAWDVAAVREQFPALWHGGGQARPIALFDGPGGSRLPASVLEAMARSAAPDALPRARAAFADWLGGAPDEIVIGPSMTALAVAASHVVSTQWRPGDNIVLTRQDHCANIDPWRQAAAARGVEVRWVRVDANGSLAMSDLERHITPRTRLLAVSAASNVVGTINDLPRLVATAKRHGALVFVDAVHFAAHRLCQVAQWDCDLLACSAYKFYGPRVAGLWCRGSLRPAKSPLGTVPAASWLMGVDAALDFVAGKAPGESRRQRLENAMAAIAAHEQRLVCRLWEGLARIRGVRLFGLPPIEARTPTVAFSVSGIAAPVLCERLLHQGMRLGCGHFNAMPLVRALDHGATDVVRAGCMMYTTIEEVDQLLDALADPVLQRCAGSRD